MAFRTLTIDSAAELHVRSGQLTIQREQDPKPLSIDLDDLACIVLANLDITLSTGALNMISAHGITILGCGRNYMPTSIMLPFAQNSRYPFTAVCLTRVRACRMPREAVRRAAARPEVAVRVIDLLSRKLQDANERNRMLSVQDPERRLAGFLLYRAEQERSDTLVLRLSDISGSIGLRPETVSRKIHVLEEKHLIEKSGQSRIRLLNSEQLKRLYVGE